MAEAVVAGVALAADGAPGGALRRAAVRDRVALRAHWRRLRPVEADGAARVRG